MKGWLFPESSDHRRASRVLDPEIIVHYWDGAAPEARQIRDISPGGAYILTAEQWYPGTIIRIIVQSRKAQAAGEAANSIVVPARVVRQGEDGVAVAFVFPNKKEEKTFHDFLAAVRPTPALTESPRSGQALVEFALIMPLVFLLAVNAVNFGGFIFAWITVTNAARAGAQYMIMSSSSPGAPTPATSAQVTSLVTNDVTSLLNRASIVVATCSNGTAAANGCTTYYDPEATTYTLATVDVTYTYNPFIPLFSFPKLGISATLPSSTIHRKVVMRMMQ